MSRYGCLPKTPDARDYQFRVTAPYSGAFVDLSAGFPEAPYDQGQLGSCVSNGTAAILDYARAKQGLAALRRPSRLYIYWYGRELSGQPIDQDTGLQVRDGLTVVSNLGAPPEDQDWPYDITKFAQRPPLKADADAKLDEAVKFGAVNVADIDATIASGYPIVFGFTVHSSFESAAVAQTGVMPVPKHGEKDLGGHCVVACSTQIDGAQIGGIPGVKYRLVRNSWGHDGSWGLPSKPGYFYMPVSVMDGPEASDFWVLTGVSDPNGPTPPPSPAPFPGALVAAVQAAADDPKLAPLLAGRYTVSGEKAATAHLQAILAAPRS